MDAGDHVSVFRCANQRVRALARHPGSPSRPMRIDFVCECASSGCSEAVPLLLPEYDALIAAGGWVLAPGHLAPDRHAIAV